MYKQNFRGKRPFCKEFSGRRTKVELNRINKENNKQTDKEATSKKLKSEKRQAA